MKKLLSLVLVLVWFNERCNAQQDKNILPKSFTLSAKLFTRPENIILPEFNLTLAEANDQQDLKNGHLSLFARNIKTNINTFNTGSWTTLPNNDRVWQVRITSQGALALIPLFDKLYLPEGATLHIFMPGKQEVIGAFTHSNTDEVRAFCSGIIHGETCLVEYYEPASVAGKGIISINEVGHAYRWIEPLTKSTNSTGAAGSCEVNVACSEANNYQDQKRAVARILVASSMGQGYCSGSLINNVRQDCTPYFLSAQHCSEGTTANQYAQWVFYFNYESSTCTGTSGSSNKTVNGCSKIADSNDNGGDSGSDFLLLQLNSQPNPTYNVYYAGWNTANTGPSSGVCIHHPDGDIKKISTYTTTCTSTSWGGSVQNTHWDVKWAGTTNGHGVTEGGSSGSPLFNNAGEITGTLTGGGSYCSTPNTPDQFGKFAYHWISNGTANNRRLKPWLDPDNTGATSLAGTNTPCGSQITNDAGVFSIISPVGFLCNASSVTPQLILRNFGSNTITTLTINYTIDGNIFQYTYNGSLTAGSTTTITLPTENLSAGNHTFTAETTLPNGQTDNNTSNDGKNISFDLVPPNGSITLNLQTDDWGSETTWEVTDNAQNIVASGGPYNDVQNGQSITENFCLEPGCYNFTIFDSYGDGMSSGNDGSFSLAGAGNTYATLSNAAFGTQETHNFCIQNTGIDESSSIQASVFPNPSSGIFSIQLNSSGTNTISVFDALGRLIYSKTATDNLVNVNLADNSKGVYLLQIETLQGKALKKLIVK